MNRFVHRKRKSFFFIMAALALVASFISGAILLYGGATKAYASDSGVASSQAVPSASSSQPNFGPNVYIFDPSMPQSQIQATVDAMATNRSPTSSELSAMRCCSSLAPMDPVPTRSTFRSATTPAVAGLGLSPNDVVINGSIYVRNQCVGRTTAPPSITSGARCRT